jgi:putative transposase
MRLARGWPRQIRIECPRAIYHVMSRGDRREAIVLGDQDRELWLRTLGHEPHDPKD